MLLNFDKEFDRKKGIAYFKKLLDDRCWADLKKPKKQRTVRQNSYLHVCLGFFCAETGYTILEAKELFSHQLPDIMRYTKKGLSFRRSTADLDSKEMNILIDTIRDMSLHQLGIYIPTSEEYLMNRFEIEKEIEHVK